MATPTHCVICSTLLAEETPSGVCPICLRSSASDKPIPVDFTDDTAITLTMSDKTYPGPRLSDASLAGQRVPHGYIPMALIGHGGMGLVFQVWEPGAERVVALKLIRAATGPELRARFGVEVKALAGIDHPNIVRVLSVDLLAPDPYFTMEFVEGQGLDQRLKDSGPLPPLEAAQLIQIVARAVHAANEAGVIHRDLKPSNVLIRSDGVPKVTDFGVAKRDGLDVDLTLTGVVVGTPAYMSPEQANGQKVTQTADVYGLGATLYAALTGHPPFLGADQSEILAKVRGVEPQRPRALRPEIPPALEAIVLKCLEKDPADRFANAAELADELGRCVAQVETLTPPLSRWRQARRWTRRHRPRIAMAVAAVVVGVGLLAAGQLLATSPEPPGPLPKPNPQEAIRRELAAGRKVVIDPAQASQWRANGVVLRESLPGEGYSFEAGGMSLLDLVSNPGIDRYRLTAQVRHQQRQSRANGTYDLSRVGIYFGAAEGDMIGNRKFHSAFTISFMDFPMRNPAPDQPADETRVRFDATLFVDHPTFNLTNHRVGIASIPFTASKHRPAEWRTIIVDVSPESLLVCWKAMEGDTPDPFIQPGPWPRSWTGEQTSELYSRLQVPLDRVTKQPRSVLLPAWSPRGGIGVMAASATVGFRNVTIEPLPNL